METSRRTLLQAATGLGLIPVANAQAATASRFSMDSSDDYILVKDAAGQPAFRYLFGKVPAGETGPAVPFTAYTHPVWTPGGEVVTDVGAKDHPHHRGVFCAWIQAEGDRNGDWWGWGQRAPKDGRTIVNRRARAIGATTASAAIEAENLWQAEADPILVETVRIRGGGVMNGHRILDYVYNFRPATRRPVVLGRQPFGGFCYRANPRGEIIISDSSGPLDRQDAHPDMPERNWPSRPWYDFSTRAPDGKVLGAAVIDHPGNPPSSWHIVRFAHMLNPCICRDGAFTIGAQGLTLRYRLAAHDGGADASALDAIAADFRKS